MGAKGVIQEKHVTLPTVPRMLTEAARRKVSLLLDCFSQAAFPRIPLSPSSFLPPPQILPLLCLPRILSPNPLRYLLSLISSKLNIFAFFSFAYNLVVLFNEGPHSIFLSNEELDS